MRFITPSENLVQQWYGPGQQISFDFKTTGASHLDADNLYLSFTLDFNEDPAQAEQFRYLDNLAVFDELTLLQHKSEILHYPRYNVLTSFVRNFLTERDIDAQYDEATKEPFPSQVH